MLRAQLQTNHSAAQVMYLLLMELQTRPTTIEKPMNLSTIAHGHW